MSLRAFDTKHSRSTAPGFTAELSLDAIAQLYPAEPRHSGHAGGAGMVVPQCRWVCDQNGHCQWVNCRIFGFP